MSVPVILVDMDGTLADNDARHAHFTANGLISTWDNEQWIAYDKAATADLVIAPVADIVNHLANSYHIAIVTGRKVESQPETELWLDMNGISYDDIFMRSSGNRSPNPKFKRAVAESLIAEGREIHLAIDDHPGVIEEMHDLGIETLLVGRPTSPHKGKG